VESISDLSKTLLDQLEEFLISYNKQRGKKFKVTGGPKKAMSFLRAAMQAHKKEAKK
jgi:inorganic pyrophosphatase